MEEYLSLIDRIFNRIDPGRVVWISLGGVRFMKGFKDIIRGNFPDERLTCGEFFPCSDGKMRYFRPQRVLFYRELAKRIKNYSPNTYVYLCMEDTSIWEEVFDLHFANSDQLAYSMHEHLKTMLGL